MVSYHSSVVARTEYSTDKVAGSILHQLPLSDLVKRTQVCKSWCAPFHLVYRSPEMLCSRRSANLVAICQLGPWRRKRHSDGSTAPLPVIEDIFESPRLPSSNGQSGAGPVGCCGRSFVHFLSSIGWRRQPRCCSGSELNEQGIY